MSVMVDTITTVTDSDVAHAIEVLKTKVVEVVASCDDCNRYAAGVMPCDQHARLNSKIAVLEMKLGDQS